MKILSSWLREWIDIDASDSDIANKLTASGLEVDNIEKIANDFKGVVVGYVVNCVKHPNADKLSLCEIDIGSEILSIVCGAKNIRSGIKVAVAVVGAKLTENFKIKKAKIRGITSFGMVCSAAELGIKHLIDKNDGILELNNKFIIGNNLRHEVNLDDNVIELDITPNRGDCFSILGIARELSVVYDITLKNINTNSKLEKIPYFKHNINIDVVAKKHCPKYLTQMITGVNNAVNTPAWIANKLLQSGQKLNSAIIDITNFVLLELGQPLHCFDSDKLLGGVTIRLAKNEKNITLLNNKSINLDDDTLIIADEKNILAVAGIMGAANSAVQKNTTNILLEAAFFDNVLIAGKARKYSLHTESSLRFERGVDFNITETAINRAAELIIEVCGGKLSNIKTNTAVEYLPKLKKINLKYHKIKKILGFELNKKWIKKTILALNFIILENNDREIIVQPNSARFDINLDIDIIEELARLYGYDNLPTKTLKFNTTLVKNNSIDKNNLRCILVNRNYNEVINYSFVSDNIASFTTDDKLKIANPISNDMSVMRSNIIVSLLKTAAYNINQNNKNIRIFEIGSCYYNDKIGQQEKIAAIITENNENNWFKNNKFNFYTIKKDCSVLIGNRNIQFIPTKHALLQEGQSAKILVDNKEIGIIGTISPFIQKKMSLNKCFAFELDLSVFKIKNTIKYSGFSRYQISNRDISFLVDKNINYSEIYNTIFSLKQKFLIGLKLLDVYNNNEISNDKKSFTISLSYQAKNKTLTDDEINNATNKVLQLLIKKYKVEQR